jgi:hypothetical protein
MQMFKKFLLFFALVLFIGCGDDGNSNPVFDIEEDDNMSMPAEESSSSEEDEIIPESSSSEIVLESSSSEVALESSSSELVLESSSSEVVLESSSSEVVLESSSSFEMKTFKCETISRSIEKSVLFMKVSLTASIDIVGGMHADSVDYNLAFSFVDGDDATMGMAETACKAVRDSIGSYQDPLKALPQIGKYLSFTPNEVDSTFFAGAEMAVNDKCSAEMNFRIKKAYDDSFSTDQAATFVEQQQARCETLKLNTDAIKKQLCDDPDWKTMASLAGYCD